MVESGFYKLDPEYFIKIYELGAFYPDRKERPIYCCLQDKKNPEIYWLIPTSDYSHRSPEQKEKLKERLESKNRLIAAYNHLGHTNKEAIYKISTVLPVTEKYISGEYTSQGKHLILRNKKEISEIQRKLEIILEAEKINPNSFEQKISTIYSFLENEVQTERIKKLVFEKGYLMKDSTLNLYIQLEKILKVQISIEELQKKYTAQKFFSEDEKNLVNRISDDFLSQRKNQIELKSNQVEREP